MSESGFLNLLEMYERADRHDRQEGREAYDRYQVMLADIAAHFDLQFERVVAAFVALAPNSDYVGNVRSLLTLLHGMAAGISKEGITTATYKHCRDRAHSYLTGETDFLDTAKGLKTRSFYFNITQPNNPDYVTIDGHMSAVWQGKMLTMKEAIVKPREYREIAADMFRLAKLLDRAPCAVQAAIWFARKRTLNIKYSAQPGLFHGADDLWGTALDWRRLTTYPIAEIASD